MVCAVTLAFGWVATLAGCAQGELTFLGPRGGDEIWAIRAITTVGGDHARSAEAYADALRKVDGLRSRLVRIIHDSVTSKVYYGRYLREYDVQTGNATFKPPHRDDLRVIRGLTLGAGGSRPFAMALPELLPIPSTHPEWDLTRQTTGHWSLHVAVFYNEGRMNQRRKAAEDYCSELRRQGELAFFHHGPVKSSVCIGLFPESALKTMTKTDRRTGTPISGTVYADPRLAALQKKFPNNLENGHIINRIVRDPVTQQIVRRTANESFVVRVPQRLGATFQP
jgi:hypothetical protein